MLDRVQIRAVVREVICHSESDDRLLSDGSDPYIWTIFFSVDGTGVSIIATSDPSDLVFRGSGIVISTDGSHGNLGHTRAVSANTRLGVPERVGTFEHEACAIPLPEPCEPLKPQGVHGYAGLVIALMEEDNVTDHGARAGYNELVECIRGELSQFIEGKSISQLGPPTEAEIQAIQDECERRTRQASAPSQNQTDNAWSAQNPDDKLGSALLIWSIQDLIDSACVPFALRFTEQAENDWEVIGEMCAARRCAFDTASSAALPENQRAAVLHALRRWRTAHFRHKRNLWAWAEMLDRNAVLVKEVLSADPEAAKLAASLFSDAMDLVRDDEKKFDQQVVDRIVRLLDLGIARIPTSAARDAHRLRTVAVKLSGRSIGEALNLLAGEAPPGFTTDRAHDGGSPSLDVALSGH